MKNTVSILILLCFATLAKAQNDLITVSLSDTVLTEGKQFVYLIMANQGEVYQEEMPLTNPNPTLENDLEIWLKGQKIKYESNEIGGEAYGVGKTYFLMFSTYEEMERVTDDLKMKVPKAMGWPVHVSAPESQADYDKLLDKLLQKAKRDAERIAKGMGKKGVSVVSVKFNRGAGTQGDGWTAYPPLGGMNGWAALSDPTAYTDSKSKRTVVISGSIEVTFLAN